MKLKRIAMISYHTCPLASREGKETGGMNVYVLETAKKLSEMGYVIDIFTRSESESQKKIVLLSHNVRVIHIQAGPEKSIQKDLLINYYNEFAHNIITLCKREKIAFDIIHSHYYLSGLVALTLLKTFTTARHIITFHTLALMKNLVARESYELEYRDRINAELALVKQADKIIALSENDKKYIVYLYNANVKNVAIASPGVDTTIFKPITQKVARRFIHANKNYKLILFVGRIEPLKGIDSLLYAVKILTACNRGYRGNICLWIVGGDVSEHKSLWSRELKKLEQLRQVLDIKTEVNFVGKRPQNELPYFYSAADVVVIPSHYETFGIVALEALACNTPVISTHVSGVSSTLESHRKMQIVPANSPIHLARQINNLISRKSSSEKKIFDSHKNFTGMSWTNTAEKIAQVYEKSVA